MLAGDICYTISRSPKHKLDKLFECLWTQREHAGYGWFPIEAFEFSRHIIGRDIHYIGPPVSMRSVVKFLLLYTMASSLGNRFAPYWGQISLQCTQLA